ncbi:MAG: DUF1566 domain-containing protein [Desulfobulbaceae bacterium]|jgi:hypothetical protein|nr:DUF1566 domain-containing protein [Desulfobulbaceae bacterium]
MKKQIFLFLIVILSLLAAVSCLAAEPRLETVGDGIVLDTQTQLMWQAGKSRKSFTSAEDAKAYVKELKIGGFSDWRIPTLAERWDLVQVFMYKNNGDIEFSKAGSRYWTGETDKGLQPLKLDFSCLCLANEEVDYSTKGYVRAVRGPVIVNK